MNISQIEQTEWPSMEVFTSAIMWSLGGLSSFKSRLGKLQSDILDA